MVPKVFYEICSGTRTAKVKSDFTIYALVDPRFSSKYRYIGATKKTLRERRLEHIALAIRKPELDAKCKWVSSLLRNGINPKIIRLEKCSVFQVEQKEREWIQKYRPFRLLTNHSSKPSYSHHWGHYGRFGYLDKAQIMSEIDRVRAMAVQLKNFPLTTKITLTNLQREIAKQLGLETLTPK